MQSEVVLGVNLVADGHKGLIELRKRTVEVMNLSETDLSLVTANFLRECFSSGTRASLPDLVPGEISVTFDHSFVKVYAEGLKLEDGVWRPVSDFDQFMLCARVFAGDEKLDVAQFQGQGPHSESQELAVPPLSGYPEGRMGYLQQQVLMHLAKLHPGESRTEVDVPYLAFAKR